MRKRIFRCFPTIWSPCIRGALLDTVNKAANDNERKAVLTQNIGKIVGFAAKTAKKAAVA